MRDNKALNFKVGLFVIFSIIVFIFVIFFLSGEKSYFEKSYSLKTNFNNTSGLITGVAVKLSGVRIGEVKTIHFSSNPLDKNIFVTMEVHKEGMRRISPDAHATIRSSGLLGDKYVEIVPGKEVPPSSVPESLTIKSFTPPELTDLIGQSGEFLDNIISISKSLRSLVTGFVNEDNIENIDNTLAAVRETAEAVEKSMLEIQNGEGILHTMIYGERDDSGKQVDKNSFIKFNQTLTLFNKLLEEINQGSGTLNALIYNKEITDNLQVTMNNIRSASEELSGQEGVVPELQKTMKNIREISEMIRGGEGTLGAFLVDPGIYDTIKGLLGQADRSRIVRSAIRYLIEEEQKSNQKN